MIARAEGPAVVIMRIRCTCNRNLADVHHSRANPDYVRSVQAVAGERSDGWETYLHVEPRRGVQASDLHDVDRPAASGSVGTLNRTYRWECRCGQTWSRRSDRLAAAWPVLWDRADARSGRARGVVLAVLDTDL